jgi:hypothetical protein
MDRFWLQVGAIVFEIRHLQNMEKMGHAFLFAEAKMGSFRASGQVAKAKHEQGIRFFDRVFPSDEVARAACRV